MIFVHWPDGKLEEIEGVTPEIAARARGLFFFDIEESDVDTAEEVSEAEEETTK